MVFFNSIEREYINRKEWMLSPDGQIILTEKQFKREMEHGYAGHSIRQPDTRTLMIASVKGCILLFENNGFFVRG